MQATEEEICLASTPPAEQSTPGYYSNECNRKTDVIYLSHYSMHRTKRAGNYRQRGMRRGMTEWGGCDGKSERELE